MRASVTRAAKGFDRRRFAAEEILRMQDAGIVPVDAETHVVFPLGTGGSCDRSSRARLHAPERRCDFRVVDARGQLTFAPAGPEGANWTGDIRRGPQATPSRAQLPGLAIRLAEV